jgi:thioredoxin 1
MTRETPSEPSIEASVPMLPHAFKWKEVKQASEPVVVDFWAFWCPPCRAINPVIKALAKDFKVCKVNVDTNQQHAAHYGVSSIPALLIFKGGKVAARHVGVTPEATLGRGGLGERSGRCAPGHARSCACKAAGGTSRPSVRPG